MTHQFLVERRPKRILDRSIKPIKLPMPIWVYLPKVPNVNYDCDCCKQIFKIEEKSVMEWIERYGSHYPERLDRYICECQGRLIE